MSLIRERWLALRSEAAIIYRYQNDDTSFMFPAARKFSERITICPTGKRWESGKTNVRKKMIDACHKKLSFISDKSAVIRIVIKRTVTKRRASELIALIDRSLKKRVCRFLLNFYRQNHFIKKKKKLSLF